MLFYVFLSKGKNLLMFNVQLCLTFERVSVMLKFWSLPLCRRVRLIVRLWITACIDILKHIALFIEQKLVIMLSAVTRLVMWGASGKQYFNNAI